MRGIIEQCREVRNREVTDITVRAACRELVGGSDARGEKINNERQKRWWRPLRRVVLRIA